MLVENNFFNLLYLGSGLDRYRKSTMSHREHLSAYSHAYHKKRSGRRTKDLIGKLLCHGARASRAARPHVAIALNVYTPDNQKAVKIKMANARRG